MRTAWIQTRALAVDAYRELNGKKLFWFTLALSGLVVAVFASLGVNTKGVTILWWTFENPVLNTDLVTPGEFYKGVFSSFGVAIWLGWLASILALVSTASIFPDLLASGSVELMLSKPISRLRLFLTKYVLGLMFVALQVLVFTGAVFVLIGVRGGEWAPSVFLAVPVVVVFFSYLFAICVLFGVLTRSTIASLLLTLLAWLFFFCLNTADNTVLFFRESNSVRQQGVATRIELLEKDLARREEDPRADGPTVESIRARLATLRSRRDELEANARSMRMPTRIVRAAKFIFPKTAETTGLIERAVGDLMPEITPSENPADDSFLTSGFGRMPEAQQQEVQRRIKAELSGRSLAWVLGTSLAFEGVVLAIAAWVFCRRDF